MCFTLRLNPPGHTTADLLIQAGPLADINTVAAACLRAGELALRGHSYREAIRWLDKALEINPNLSDGMRAHILDALARSETASKLGEAVQDQDRAAALAIQAFSLHTQLGNVDSAVKLAATHGTISGRIAQEVLLPALEYVEPGTVEEALIESKLAIATASSRSDSQGAIGRSDRSVAIAEELGDDLLRAWVYGRRAEPHGQSHRMDRSRRASGNCDGCGNKC